MVITREHFTRPCDAEGQLWCKVARMPMIDVYADAEIFGDKHQLAQDLASAVMRWEAVPEIPLFADNTAAFIHDLPGDAISTAKVTVPSIRSRKVRPSTYSVVI